MRDLVELRAPGQSEQVVRKSGVWGFATLPATMQFSRRQFDPRVGADNRICAVKRTRAHYNFPTSVTVRNQALIARCSCTVEARRISRPTADAASRVKAASVSCLIIRTQRPVRGPYLLKYNGNTYRMQSGTCRYHKRQCGARGGQLQPHGPMLIRSRAGVRGA